MNLERLTQPLINTALSVGQYVMYQLRELETPPTTPASIQHYGTKEAPLDGAPLDGPAAETQPDYTKQLEFHEQQLLNGLPEAMQAHHQRMRDILSKEAA